MNNDELIAALITQPEKLDPDIKRELIAYIKNKAEQAKQEAITQKWNNAILWHDNSHLRDRI